MPPAIDAIAAAARDLVAVRDAWLAGHQQLAQRLSATNAYLETLRIAQQPTVETAPARRLGVRLVQARKKSAYFASAFYLGAA